MLKALRILSIQILLTPIRNMSQSQAQQAMHYIRIIRNLFYGMAGLIFLQRLTKTMHILNRLTLMSEK